MEQVGLAALDAGAVKLAASIVAAVKTHFPGSRRAGRLAAAFLEAVGEADGAEGEIEAGLAAAPDSALLLKRRIAALRGSGQAAAAAAALTEYVDTFQADGDAWGELGRVHAEAGRAGPAAFCADEAVLHAPACAASHAAAGDAHYTAGAVSQAARHYEAAVALSGGEDVRALYGVCVAAAAAASAGGGGGGGGGKKGGGAEPPPADPVPGLAAATLLRKYREEAPAGLLPIVEACLKGMGVEAAEQ